MYTARRYQAALLSLLMLCSLVFKQVYHSPMKKKTNENTEVSYFANFVNLSIWFDKRYILWVTVVPLALTGYFVPYVHIVSVHLLKYTMFKNNKLDKIILFSILLLLVVVV